MVTRSVACYGAACYYSFHTILELMWCVYSRIASTEVHRLCSAGSRPVHEHVWWRRCAADSSGQSDDSIALLWGMHLVMYTALCLVTGVFAAACPP
jgi:hypothetical protein